MKLVSKYVRKFRVHYIFKPTKEKKMKNCISIALVSLVITGCSSIGGEDKFSRNYINSHVIPNKTTQSEVKALYGEPSQSGNFSNGGSEWIYFKQDSTPDLLGIAGQVSSYIPMGSSFSKGYYTAAKYSAQANGLASKIPKSMLHGDSDQHSNGLTIDFDKNNTVINWTM